MHIFEPSPELAADMTAVDGVIRARLTSEVALVSQIADYIIGAGGKRIRPVLVLSVAAAFGYRGPKAHELAAVVELIHTATLLHDDVVDESGLRRGRQTANALFGNAASVLVGDFLYSRSFQMMVAAGSLEIMQVLSEATNVIAEGEVLQLMNIGDADISEAQYLQVIRYKTAKLFEASARLGAIAASADDLAKQRMAAFGMHLGTAFQLVDDALDYAGDASETGKITGGDLSEGKPTLPLLHVLTVGTRTQREVVQAALAEPGNADFTAVLAAIHACDSLAYTHRAAEAETALAAAALDRLPESAGKQTLLQLCASAVARKG